MNTTLRQTLRITAEDLETLVDEVLYEADRACFALLMIAVVCATAALAEAYLLWRLI
jgi:hypothetical protein